MAAPSNSPWTIVCVTASTEAQARAVEVELTERQKSGVFGQNVLFYAVPDPSNARVGSGGATFNALLTVQELISSTPLTLDSVRVFMIHSGGDSQRLPSQSVCGKAWSALPTYSPTLDLDAPIDLLVTVMFRLFAGVPAGLVVASSDVLLQIPPGFAPVWPVEGSCATGLAIPTPASYGPNHGVYQAAPGGVGGAAPVAKFWQKASVPELAAAGAVRPDGTVLIDSGVIYFSPTATLQLTELARTHPLDCTTYLGLDMDRKALRIELYSEVMMAMGGGLGLSKAAYHATPTSDGDGLSPRMTAARDAIWETLTDTAFHTMVVEGGGFAHVGTTVEYLQLLTAPSDFQRLYGLRTKAAFFEEGKRVTTVGGCEGGGWGCRGALHPYQERPQRAALPLPPGLPAAPLARVFWPPPPHLHRAQLARVVGGAQGRGICRGALPPGGAVAHWKRVAGVGGAHGGQFDPA